jgi:hypothetical protein
MSPASYLTAPPRVAGRIIARLAEAHVSASGTCATKLTQPRFRTRGADGTQDMVRERIAYHEARAREEEERKRKAADSA